MQSESGLEKLPIQRGGRFGGLLAQSAVMTATANGVDTQPVLRGVWVLENILGMPPPPAPKSRGRGIGEPGVSLAISMHM